MTTQRSFKRLVRSRMEKTGESYTAARARCCAGGRAAAHLRSLAPPTRRSASAPAAAGRSGSTCSTSGARPSARTARSRAGSPSSRTSTRSPGTCRRSSSSYERTRGLRAVGEHADGFAITATKTVAVPVERLFDAFVDARCAQRWLPDGELRERTATKPRSARFDWGDGATPRPRHVRRQGRRPSTAALQHVRLADAAEAERMKAFWRERVAGAEGGAGGMSAASPTSAPSSCPSPTRTRRWRSTRHARLRDPHRRPRSATASAGSRSRRPARRRRSRSCRGATRMEVSLATADAEADHAALLRRGRRRRRGADPHGRLRAADVHVPRPRRQPLPDGRARLAALGDGRPPLARRTRRGLTSPGEHGGPTARQVAAPSAALVGASRPSRQVARGDRRRLGDRGRGVAGPRRGRRGRTGDPPPTAPRPTRVARPARLSPARERAGHRALWGRGRRHRRGRDRGVRPAHRAHAGRGPSARCAGGRWG